MNQMNQQKLKDNIYLHFEKDWGKQSTQFSTCVEIFDYLSSRPVSQLKHLTLGSLKNAVKNHYSDIDMLTAIQYLCGDAIPVLSLHFEFIDDNDQSFDLGNHEIIEAKKEGKLVHPGTGEYIENYEEKVLMYFTPGILVKKAHN